MAPKEVILMYAPKIIQEKISLPVQKNTINQEIEKYQASDSWLVWENFLQKIDETFCV